MYLSDSCAVFIKCEIYSQLNRIYRFQYQLKTDRQKHNIQIDWIKINGKSVPKSTMNEQRIGLEFEEKQQYKS